MSTHALQPSIASLIDQAADRWSVSRPVARAVAWIESRGNPAARSPKGAMGVMQLMAATAQQLGVTDPFDAAQNIDGGVKYLSQLIARYGERAGLAAYNWGPGNVARRGGAEGSEFHWPAEVKTYVTNVLQRAEYELATMNVNAASTAAMAGGSLTAVAPLSSGPVRLSSVLPSTQHERDDDDDLA